MKSYSFTKYLLLILLLHVIGVIFIFPLAKESSYYLGLIITAYILGVRHAFDADHIVAIDNTVRKLVQQKKNATGVGFYFSLGHSTVVFLLVLFVGVSANWIKENMPQFQEVGGIIGATVSGLFLLIVGAINLGILISIYQKIKQRSSSNEEVELNGFIYRFTKKLFTFVNESWHIYPLGFLFGLGFDTATEIGLLTMSAQASISGTLTMTSVLGLPISFMAGMCLMDTIDSIFMTNSYQWALNSANRKLYYNFVVTAISVVMALLIGTVELLQVASEQFSLTGGLWNFVSMVEFEYIGYAIVVGFIVLWSIAYFGWKRKKLTEEME